MPRTDWKAWLSRARALRAYRKRERARDDKRTPIVWYSHVQLVSVDIALLHEIEPEHVNEPFLEKLIRGRDEALKALATQNTISWGITGFLALDYLKIDVPVSIAGFTLSSSPGVAELLMLVSAGLFFLGLSRLVSTLVLGEAIKSCIRSIYPPESWYLHKLRLFPAEPPVLFPHPMTPRLAWELPGRIAAWFTIWVLLAILAVLIVGFLTTRGIVYSHIWNDSEVWFGQGAVLLSAAMDLIGLAYILMFVVPFPYRDYSLNDTFEIAEQLGRPDTRAALLREHYGEGARDKIAMIEAGLLPADPPEDHPAAANSSSGNSPAW